MNGWGEEGQLGPGFRDMTTTTLGLSRRLPGPPPSQGPGCCLKTGAQSRYAPLSTGSTHTSCGRGADSTYLPTFPARETWQLGKQGVCRPRVCSLLGVPSDLSP